MTRKKIPSRYNPLKSAEANSSQSLQFRKVFWHHMCSWCIIPDSSAPIQPGNFGTMVFSQSAEQSNSMRPVWRRMPVNAHLHDHEVFNNFLLLAKGSVEFPVLRLEFGIGFIGLFDSSKRSISRKKRSSLQTQPKSVSVAVDFLVFVYQSNFVSIDVAFSKKIAFDKLTNTQ